MGVVKRTRCILSRTVGGCKYARSSNPETLDAWAYTVRSVLLGVSVAFGRKNKGKGKRFSTSVAAARTSDAALNAIRQDQAEEDQQDAIVRSNVYKMIDQGTGTIVDLWAPPRMKILSDYIELGDEALTICTVSNWPTQLQYGWLNRLLEDPSIADVKIDVSMHIHPIRKEYALSYMKDKKVSAVSSKQAETSRGKKETAATRAYDAQIETAEQIYELLKDNDSENLFQVSLTFGIYGHEVIETDAETGERYVVKDAKEDVIEKMDRFKRALAKNSGGGFAVKPLLHQQRDGIKSLLPWGYGGLHSFQNMYTSALATCFPFTHGELAVEDGILYGINPATQQPYFFNSFNRDWVKSYSTVIIGSTGSGKSATVKTLLGRYAIHGTQVFVIDPAINTQGEYTNLATSLDGVTIDFGGKTGVYMNPFELVPPMSWHLGEKTDQRQAEQTYRTKKEYLIGLFDLMKEKYIQENQITASNLDLFSKILSILIDRLYTAKHFNIISGKWDYRMWNPDAMPTMTDMYNLVSIYCDFIQTYDTNDKIMGWGTQNTDQRGQLRDTTFKGIVQFGYYRSIRNNTSNVWGRAELRVLKFVQNFLEEYVPTGDEEVYSEKASLFTGRRKANLQSGCIVFRFGNVSNTLKDIATYLTFELIYQRINSAQDGSDKYRHYIVAMDECWKLLQTEYARNYIIKLSREGRKLNTGIWITSQKYSDFLGNNKVLFDQSETKIIMSLSDEEVNQLSNDIDLSPTLAGFINADQRATSPGCGLLHISGKRHTTVAFYCVMSKMEQAIADTVDSTKPPMTAEEIRSYVR